MVLGRPTRGRNPARSGRPGRRRGRCQPRPRVAVRRDRSLRSVTIFCGCARVCADEARRGSGRALAATLAFRFAAFWCRLRSGARSSPMAAGEYVLVSSQAETERKNLDRERSAKGNAALTCLVFGGGGRLWHARTFAPARNPRTENTCKQGGNAAAGARHRVRPVRDATCWRPRTQHGSMTF
jgi:hypothetical protein